MRLNKLSKRIRATLKIGVVALSLTLLTTSINILNGTSAFGAGEVSNTGSGASESFANNGIAKVPAGKGKSGSLRATMDTNATFIGFELVPTMELETNKSGDVFYDKVTDYVRPGENTLEYAVGSAMTSNNYKEIYNNEQRKVYILKNLPVTEGMMGEYNGELREGGSPAATLVRDFGTIGLFGREDRVSSLADLMSTILAVDGNGSKFAEAYKGEGNTGENLYDALVEMEAEGYENVEVFTGLAYEPLVFEAKKRGMQFIYVPAGFYRAMDWYDYTAGDEKPHATYGKTTNHTKLVTQALYTGWSRLWYNQYLRGGGSEIEGLPRTKLVPVSEVPDIDDSTGFQSTIGKAFNAEDRLGAGSVVYRPAQYLHPSQNTLANFQRDTYSTTLSGLVPIIELNASGFGVVNDKERAVSTFKNSYPNSDSYAGVISNMTETNLMYIVGFQSPIKDANGDCDYSAGALARILKGSSEYLIENDICDIEESSGKTFEDKMTIAVDYYTENNFKKLNEAYQVLDWLFGSYYQDLSCYGGEGNPIWIRTYYSYRHFETESDLSTLSERQTTFLSSAYMKNVDGSDKKTKELVLEIQRYINKDEELEEDDPILDLGGMADEQKDATVEFRQWQLQAAFMAIAKARGLTSEQEDVLKHGFNIKIGQVSVYQYVSTYYVDSANTTGVGGYTWAELKKKYGTTSDTESAILYDFETRLADNGTSEMSSFDLLALPGQMFVSTPNTMVNVAMNIGDNVPGETDWALTLACFDLALAKSMSTQNPVIRTLDENGALYGKGGDAGKLPIDYYSKYDGTQAGVGGDIENAIIALGGIKYYVAEQLGGGFGIDLEYNNHSTLSKSVVSKDCVQQGTNLGDINRRMYVLNLINRGWAHGYQLYLMSNPNGIVNGGFAQSFKIMPGSYVGMLSYLGERGAVKDIANSRGFIIDESHRGFAITDSENRAYVSYIGAKNVESSLSRLFAKDFTSKRVPGSGLYFGQLSSSVQGEYELEKNRMSITTGHIQGAGNTSFNLEYFTMPGKGQDAELIQAVTSEDVLSKLHNTCSVLNVQLYLRRTDGLSINERGKAVVAVDGSANYPNYNTRSLVTYNSKLVQELCCISSDIVDTPIDELEWGTAENDYKGVVKELGSCTTNWFFYAGYVKAPESVGINVSAVLGFDAYDEEDETTKHTVTHDIDAPAEDADEHLVLGLSVTQDLLKELKDENKVVYAHITLNGDKDNNLIYAKVDEKTGLSTLESSAHTANGFSWAETEAEEIAKYGQLSVEDKYLNYMPPKDGEVGYNWDRQYADHELYMVPDLGTNVEVDGNADSLVGGTDKQVLVVNLTERLEELGEDYQVNGSNYRSNTSYDFELARWSLDVIGEFDYEENDITLQYERDYTVGMEIALVIEDKSIKEDNEPFATTYYSVDLEKDTIQSNYHDKVNSKIAALHIAGAGAIEKRQTIDDKEVITYKLYPIAGLGANTGKYREIAKDGKFDYIQYFQYLEAEGKKKEAFIYPSDTLEGVDTLSGDLNQLWFRVNEPLKTPIDMSATVIYTVGGGHERNEVEVGASIGDTATVKVNFKWSEDTEKNPDGTTIEEWAEAAKDADIDTVIVWMPEVVSSAKVYDIDEFGGKEETKEAWLMGTVGQMGMNKDTSLRAVTYNIDDFIKLLTDGGTVTDKYTIENWSEVIAVDVKNNANTANPMGFHNDEGNRIEYGLQVAVIGLAKSSGNATYNAWTTKKDEHKFMSDADLSAVVTDAECKTYDILKSLNATTVDFDTVGKTKLGAASGTDKHDCYLIAAGGDPEPLVEAVIVRSHLNKTGYESFLPYSYATIKEGGYGLTSKTPNQNYNVLQGVPSTSKLYYTSGASEFIVELSLVRIEDEEAYRTYTSVWAGRKCKFQTGDIASAGGGTTTSVTKNQVSHTYNNESVVGTLTDTFSIPVPVGYTSATYTVPAHGGRTITATWTGTIKNTTANPGIVRAQSPIDQMSAVSDAGTITATQSGNGVTTNYSVAPGTWNGGYAGEMANHNQGTNQDLAGSAGGTYSWDTSKYNTALQQAYNWGLAIENASKTASGNISIQSDSDHATRTWHAGEARFEIKISGVNTTEGSINEKKTVSHKGTWSDRTLTTANVTTRADSGGGFLNTNEDALSSGWFEKYGSSELFYGSSINCPGKSPAPAGGDKLGENISVTWTDESSINTYVRDGGSDPWSRTDTTYIQSYNCTVTTDVHTGSEHESEPVETTQNWPAATWCGYSNASEYKAAVACSAHDVGTPVSGHSDCEPCPGHGTDEDGNPIACTATHTHYSWSGCNSKAAVPYGGHTCSASHNKGGYVKSTTVKAKDLTYTIRVYFVDTYTEATNGGSDADNVSRRSCGNGNYPAHSLCGPCCQHNLPTITDNWVQYSNYSYISIEDISVWKVFRSYMTGLNDITFELDDEEYFLANIENGDPNIWYNIADMNPVYKSHLLYGKKQEASASGRLRYTVQPQQLDDVIWKEKNVDGVAGMLNYRPGDCDGMFTTMVSSNPAIITTAHRGHDVSFGLGCLYARTKGADGLKAKYPTTGITISQFLGVDDARETQSWVYSNKVKSVNYTFDGKTYTNWYYEDATALADTQEVYTHKVGWLDSISGASDKETYANNAIDARDLLTAEYGRWKERRETNVTTYLASDFLILQTSTGDRPVVYGEEFVTTTCEEDITGLDQTVEECLQSYCSQVRLPETNWMLNNKLLGGYNGKGNTEAGVEQQMFTGDNVSKKYTIVDTGRNKDYSADKVQQDSKANVLPVRKTFKYVEQRMNTAEPYYYKATPLLGQYRMVRPSYLKIGKQEIQIDPTMENELYKSEVANQAWFKLLDWTDTSSPADAWKISEQFKTVNDPVFSGMYVQEAYYYGTKKINNVVVHTPVSNTYTYIENYDGPIEDQRSVSGELGGQLEAEGYCPGTSELCTHAVLDCKYYEKEVVFATKFDEYTGMLLPGSSAYVQYKTLDLLTGVLRDTVNLHRVKVPTIVTVSEGTTSGNVAAFNYTNANDGAFEINLADIGLGYRGSLRYTIGMWYQTTASKYETTLWRTGNVRMYLKANDNNNLYVEDGTGCVYRYAVTGAGLTGKSIEYTLSYNGLNDCVLKVNGAVVAGTKIYGEPMQFASNTVGMFFEFLSGSNKSLVYLDTLSLTREPGKNTHEAGCYAVRYIHEQMYNYTCDVPVLIDASTKSAQAFTAPVSGKYKIECYGAAGGGVNASASNDGTANSGGLGAYASGEIYLSKGQTIYAYVGQKGTYANNGTNLGGGWNFGGNASGEAYGGGGMTHVSLVSTDTEGVKDGIRKVNVAPYATPVKVVETTTVGAGSVQLTPGIYFLEAIGLKEKASGFYLVTKSGNYYYTVGDASWINDVNSSTNTILTGGTKVEVKETTTPHTSHTHTNSCGKNVTYSVTYNDDFNSSSYHYSARVTVPAGGYYYICPLSSRSTYMTADPYSGATYCATSRTVTEYCSCYGGAHSDPCIIMWSPGSTTYTCNNLPLNTGGSTTTTSTEVSVSSVSNRVKEGLTKESEVVDSAVQSYYWVHPASSYYNSDTLHTTSSSSVCTQCGSTSGTYLGTSAKKYAHTSGCTYQGATHYVSTSSSQCRCGHTCGGGTTVTAGTTNVRVAEPSKVSIYRYADLSAYADATMIEYVAQNVDTKTTVNTNLTFSPNGSLQSTEIEAGTYTIEAWGAAGSGSYAGKGGYSKGTYTITSPKTLYIYAGKTTDVSGTYAGGGASYVSLRSALLPNLTSYKSDILLVAGGGGGGNNSSYVGGAGGGANQNGANGYVTYSGNVMYGLGGGNSSSYSTSYYTCCGGASGSTGCQYNNYGGYHNSYISNSITCSHGVSQSHISCHNCSDGYWSPPCSQCGDRSGFSGSCSSGYYYHSGYLTSGSNTVTANNFGAGQSASGGAAGGQGYYGGYRGYSSAYGAGGGSGYANTSLVSNVVGTSGTRSGNGEVKITGTKVVGSVSRSVTSILVTMGKGTTGDKFDLDAVLVAAGGGGGASSKSTGTVNSTGDMSGGNGGAGDELTVVKKFTYSGGEQSIKLPAGTYKLEAWGASGGGTDGRQGLGGYTSGVITLEKETTIYVYVGQAGTRKTSGDGASATFNGGGDGGLTNMNGDGGHMGGSGGGATDFRIVGGAWNSLDGLKSRILVAGGGGGSGCASSHNPGHGGGLTGATTLNPSGTYAGASASGGSQTEAGKGVGKWASSYGYSQGGFGYGSNAEQCGAGGGGGYYGGGSEYTAGGGGGSSYVSGYVKCDTTYLENQKFVYDGKTVQVKFTGVELLQGINSGNGYAVISRVETGKANDLAENGSYNGNLNYGGQVGTAHNGAANGIGESYAGGMSVGGGGGGYYGGKIAEATNSVPGKNFYDSRGCEYVGESSLRITNTSVHNCGLSGYGAGGRYVEVSIIGTNLEGKISTLSYCSENYGQQIVSTYISNNNAVFVIDKGAANASKPIGYGIAWKAAGAVIEKINITVLGDSVTGSRSIHLGGGAGGTSYVKDTMGGANIIPGVNFGDGKVVITLMEHAHDGCSYTDKSFNNHVHTANCVAGDNRTQAALARAVYDAKMNNDWTDLAGMFGKSDANGLKNVDGKNVYSAVANAGYTTSAFTAVSNLAKSLNVSYLNKIDKFGEMNNPMFSCYNHNDVHVCGDKCSVKYELSCSEPHHTGKHYGKGNEVCYSPCNDDTNHQKVAGMNGVNASEIADRIHLDDHFTLYWNNIGDFYDVSAGIDRYGSNKEGTKKGEGYVDNMDTTNWIRAKFIRFNEVDVLFYNEHTGLWEQYLAGETIKLPVVSDGVAGNGNDDVTIREWQDLDQRDIAVTRYDFYLLLSNNEHNDTLYEVWTEALNEPQTTVSKHDVYSIASDYVDRSASKSTNFDRTGASAYEAHESVYNKMTFDVVGSVGNMLITWSEDFRYWNFFKTSATDDSGNTDWYIDKVVANVNKSQQNNYISLGVDSGNRPCDVRFRTTKYASGYYNTWKTQEWTAKSTPVESCLNADIRVEVATEGQETLLGYKMFGEITTIGDYDTVKIMPSVYILDTLTGDIMAADVWVKTSEGYKLNMLSGMSEGMTTYYKSNGLSSLTDAKYDEIRDASTETGALYVSLNVEKELRNVSDAEIQRTNELDAAYFPPRNPTEEEYPFNTHSVSELLQYIGDSTAIELDSYVRTYVGSSTTNGEVFNGIESTNIAGKVPEWQYATQARRWLFTLGLEENSYIIPYSKAINNGVHMNPNYKNSDGSDPLESWLYNKEALESDRYAVLYCVDILARASEGPWTLEYEAYRGPQILKVNGKIFSVPTSIPDVVAISSVKMEEEDYDIIQSH